VGSLWEKVNTSGIAAWLSMISESKWPFSRFLSLNFYLFRILIGASGPVSFA
jgi:hypothetical protein